MCSTAVHINVAPKTALKLGKDLPHYFKNFAEVLRGGLCNAEMTLCNSILLLIISCLVGTDTIHYISPKEWLLLKELTQENYLNIQIYYLFTNCTLDKV